ncbi:hypothetical protein [Streptomyces asiaticus]|uniref:hypothetical protein n=1 Tax=Streptomyces asiaticus TaxID=114695 RepID=UPI003F67D870
MQAEQDGVAEVGAERGEQASRRWFAAGVSDADPASELLAQLCGVGVDAEVGQFRDTEVVADFEHGVGDGFGAGRAARTRVFGQLQDDMRRKEDYESDVDPKHDSCRQGRLVVTSVRLTAASGYSP